MDKKLNEEELEKLAGTSKGFLLAVGLLLVNSLSPEDFTDLEVKKMEITLPKNLINNKGLLDLILLSSSSIYEALIRNYLYYLEKDDKTTLLALNEIKYMIETISKKVLSKEDNCIQIGDFTIPIKKTIQ